ncbi:hypothetical protein NXH76_03200 [Blautia schinkii]|nr:hypothetical protein [Blautia schinkii]
MAGAKAAVEIVAATETKAAAGNGAAVDSKSCGREWSHSRK